MLFVLQLVKMRYSFIQENREKYEYVLHKCESCKKLHYTKLHLNNNTILLPQPSIQLIACKVSMFYSYQLILMHKATKETKRGALTSLELAKYANESY